MASEERPAASDYGDVDAITAPIESEPAEDATADTAREPPRRGRQADSAVITTARHSSAHHGPTSRDARGLLFVMQAALWIACGFVILVGGVLFMLALANAKDAGERTAAGATYSAFFIGAYIVARAGEKLTEILSGK